MKTFGLALGGGGAKGLAHILMLEALDELGVKPCRIAGTSIGAVIGALYASGMPPAEIREGIEALIDVGDNHLMGAIFNREIFKLMEFFEPEFGPGGLVRGEKIINFLRENMRVATFEELEMPLRVVAADFWRREQVVLETGELLPAVKASMALPLLFSPVVLDERVLVDGGTVNPVPWDLLGDECGATVAVDVMGTRTRSKDGIPSWFDAVFNTIQIMEKSILREKLAHKPPDIYIEPDISDIGALEFYRIREIYEKSRPACDRLKRELKQVLELD